MRTVIIFVALGASVFGQQDFRRFTAHLGGGGSFSGNQLSNYLKNGFNLTVGGGVRVNPRFDLLGEFATNQVGVQDQVLQDLAVPDGNASFYSLTGNAKVNLLGRSRFNLYGIGGGGWYRRTVDFTEPTTRFVSVIDPWWGYVGDVEVPTNRLLGSVTRDAPGVNLGGGFDLDVGEGTKIFGEVRWHRAFHSPTNSTLVPITFGIRF